MSNAPTVPSAADETRTGLLFALGAYGLWGFMPAYLKLTASVPSDLVVAHRVVWSILFVGLFLLVRSRMGELVAIFRSPKIIASLAVSAGLIGINWLVFVWAIERHMVLDVSLGYFINPLVSVLVGLVFLREKLTPAQTVAIALATLAVLSQVYLAGVVPWVSLSLAGAFAAYGYIRKVTPVKATPGLMAETLLLLPFAGGFIAWQFALGADVLLLGEPLVFLALVGTGIVTALPLALFSAAARRLPLVLVGLMQYLAPSMQFLMAVFIWDEPLDPVRLTGFVIIWCALAIFSVDSVVRWRRRSAARPAT